MSLSVLIVTPQKKLSENIRQILVDNYDSHVVIVGDVLGALKAFDEENFTHAFLDTQLRNGVILELGLALRKIDPGLRLTLISSEDSTPLYEALRPWTLLPQPFSLPDLLRIIDQDAGISADLPVAELESNNTIPDTMNWLEDVNKAAQHLTRLTLGSSAQAALIIRRSALWAYSGQLSQASATELVGIVSGDKKTGDLLKFIRLETTEAEHMLYATELADHINLAMVFDAETPFSTIRSQATNLADALAFSPQDKPAAPVENPVQPEEDDSRKEYNELRELFDFGDDDIENLPPITQILENVPLPNPDGSVADGKKSTPVSPRPSRPISAINDEPMPDPFGRTRASTPIDHPVNSSVESSPAIRLDETRETNVALEDASPSDLGETRVSRSALQRRNSTPLSHTDLAETRVSRSVPRPNEIDLAATRVSKPASEPIDLAATRVSKAEEDLKNSREPNTERPHSITEVAGRVLAEPGTAGLYDLTYACLLLPRFTSHHLAGDLADRLSEWMPNISVAFGWRLEYISVRPDYLQWVINVPPTASPGYLMRIIRKQTSERIFADFPRLKRDNPSGDFWAPGYLIMGGSQPHPSKLVKDYIQRTRERQGML